MTALPTEDPILALRKHIESALVQKAGTDPEFRAQLLADPDAALTALLGRQSPLDLKLRVIEEQPGEAVVVLPSAINTEELPDELLDLASGGVSFSAFVLYGPPYPDSKPKKR
ncbi:NHLP leader peptide family RiPP precursor [Novispirillum itersonii]|uniref:NHLP leader peptide family natural product n=1 Tax=Novispirillum itersonii TaxID=189 RepID=A0A7X0DPT6_NOVIT|nr:NHLP leader peptide family RiPP precursor [Novispirillum itersonii]MBB6211607.1 hypothetical protein [Novispirillum itersonii]